MRTDPKKMREIKPRQGRAEKFRAPPQLPGFTNPGPKVGS